MIPPDYYFEMVRQVTQRKRDPEAVGAALRRYEDIMGSSTHWQRKTILLKKDMEGPAGGADCISIPDFSRKAPGRDDPFYITAILRAMGSCNGTGEGMLWMISDGRNDKMLQDTAGFVARYIPVYLNPRNNSLRTVVRQIECLKAYPELEDTLYPMEGFFDMLHYNHVGRLEEQGEIEVLTESFEDLRVFDVAPGILSIILTDHPEDPGMDLYLYYSLNHYREESINRFLERVCEELRLLEAEKRR